jgi:hypothetical protein
MAYGVGDPSFQACHGAVFLMQVYFLILDCNRTLIIPENPVRRASFPLQNAALNGRAAFPRIFGRNREIGRRISNTVFRFVE